MLITPKIDQLMRSEYIVRVNEMLDAGTSPNGICDFLASQGFNISPPTMYKYRTLRNDGLLDSARDEQASVQSTTDISELESTDAAHKDRLLTELEALDLLIEKGYQAIKNIDPKEITPRILMEAIRLKNELTGGNHAFLTEYGYNSLKKLDDKKWQMVMQYMMSFISDDKQAEFCEEIEKIETSVYKGTPWYNEYMKARQMKTHA